MSLGETAGRYRIVGRIAAGGMGEVYRATMESVGGVVKTVALKVVKSQLARDPDFSALFVEEVKVAMTLSHANVVQAFDVGRIDDRWYLAMEHVDGVDLTGLMNACERRVGQRIPHRYVLFLVVEALKGLDYAHRRRGPDGEALHIVHRDVSPGNLLVSFEGEVKVVDFGIAKSAMRSFGSMAGTVKGKIPYMAPEQLRGAPVDRRADIYSVGAVLYELLTGRRVVDEEDASEAIPQVLKGDFPRPRELEPSVSEKLDRIVMKALAPQPEERYPSAASMRQELERLALEEGYLLSSADLADFVTEVVAREQVAQARPSRTSTTPGRPVVAEGGVAVPEESATSSAEGDPFDALLGAELEAVRTSEPFSVFTTSDGQRLTPRTSAPSTPSRRRSGTAAPRNPDASGSGPPAVAATPARVESKVTVPVQRRGLLIVGGVLAAALVAGVVYAAASGTDGATGTADLDEAGDDDVVSAANEPTATGPDTDEAGGSGSPNAAELPEGVEPPPAGFEAHDAGATEEQARVQAEDDAARRRRARRRARAERTSAAATMGSTPSTMEAAPDPANAPANAEPALLSVNTDPWSYVYVDGERLGPTPQLRKQLPPGRHRIRMHNPSEDLEREVVVELGSGDHRRITLDLRP